MNREREALYLGVDGGQSTTEAVIADFSGIVLSRASGGPCNHVLEPGGGKRLREAIQGSVGGALKEYCGGTLERTKFKSAFFAMTGVPDQHRPIIAELVQADLLTVDHDSVGALMGATAGKPGVIVIAGTGSVALALNRRGEKQRTGGWGYLFGDEGSAFDIARRGVAACLKQRDGLSPATGIEQKLLGELQIEAIEALVRGVYSGEISRTRLASLASCVEQAALEGDNVAKSILVDAATSLANLVSPLVRGNEDFASAVDVYCIGGVFRSSIVREAFGTCLAETAPASKIRRPQFEPVLGALLLAYRQAGIPVKEKLLRNLRKSWKELN